VWGLFEPTKSTGRAGGLIRTVVEREHPGVTLHAMLFRMAGLVSRHRSDSLSNKPSKARSRAATASDSTVRILLVDDHPVVRKGLSQIITQQADLDVVAEADGYHHALEMLKEHEIDMAIVDLTLKDISGLDLIKQLKVLYPDLKTLVLSMHDENLYAERALRAGAGGYIMKQEDAQDLVAAIRVVMSGEIFITQAIASKMIGKMTGSSDAANTSPIERLSDRELEVFELLGRGLGTRQIAERLCISIKTVQAHREHIKGKLKIATAAELVRHATQWALETGAD
jgi:DNA-binding NarL/FixJ family response regulator